MTIGIYRLYNIDNNNSYIGQSQNIENRFIFHTKDLKDNKHHQHNLQKEYNKLKNKLKREYKNNELSLFIDYDKLTIDKYYRLEVLKEFNSYNLDEILTHEDKYILEYRNVSIGYKQKLNNELTLDPVKELIESNRKLYPHYFEFMDNKFKEDHLKYKDIETRYTNKQITFNQFKKEIIRLSKEHKEEYIKLHGRMK